ncbi:hypothetical protein [uncultured Gammaproteobacteria bacterium]|nr:hypothetical protein [uncultured Gammaproteobacteria bacterium]
MPQPKTTLLLFGMVNHDKNIHDSKTLDVTIDHVNNNKEKDKPIR